MPRLFLLLFLFPFTISAQITITDSDMPAVDDVIVRAVADTFLQVDPTPTGSNYTWNFSNLNAIATQADTFQAFSAAPAVYTFVFFGAANRVISLNVNQGLGQLQLSDAYQFFNVTTTGFFDAGFAGSVNGIPLPARYDVPDKIYQFPLSANDTFSSSSTIDITIPNLVSYKSRVDRFTEVDGYGTLYLPGDTFDVLRVKSTVDQLDSLDVQGSPFPVAIPRQTIEYKWLAKGEGTPVLQINQINVIGTGLTTQVLYKPGANPPTSVNLPQDPAWQLYPNVVSPGETMQFSGNAQGALHYNWINIAGQVVDRGATRATHLAVPALPKGWYWVQLWDDQQMKLVEVLVQ